MSVGVMEDYKLKLRNLGPQMVIFLFFFGSRKKSEPRVKKGDNRGTLHDSPPLVFTGVIV